MACHATKSNRVFAAAVAGGVAGYGDKAVALAAAAVAAVATAANGGVAAEEMEAQAEQEAPMK